VVSAVNTAGAGPDSSQVSATPQAPLSPDFTISASPSSQTITVGAGTSYTTTVNALNGFTGAVSFSVTGLPGGASGAFSPASVTGSGTSTLSVTTTAPTPTGTYTLTITGTSGTLVHSITTTLVVNAASSLTLTDADVGGPALAGSASNSSGVWTVNGSGSDISLTNDQFNYDYRSVTGDTTIVARVASQQNTNAYAKSGVMIRETLSTYSRQVDVVMTPSHGVAMDYRSSTGGSTTHLAAANTFIVPSWVKLVRSGNSFTGYVSSDGATWTQVGTVTFTMASSATEGLAVCSHNTSVLNTSTFDNVTATP
jgi:regulation of enolase protein 1 (concanavalin A-like superfamily)